MAELILERITELQALPQDQHLFCPREGSEDGSAYYEEDLAGQPPDDDDAAAIAERNEKLKQAEERKWATLDALQILAFEGPEAKPYHDWISERMNGLMTSCDVCIRVFHKSRAEWKARLVEQYEEDNIESFLRIVDDFCLQRIVSGLSAGQAALEAAEPKKRTVRYLPSEAMYAFFEALGCDALLRNEELLQRHFDRPFELVQTRKRLKLPTMLPAMTRFMFSSNEVRRAWALDSWSDFRRDVLPSEFEWAVRPHLEDAMWRVQMTNLDLPFAPHFWEGVKLIITKVDKRVVAESIRGLEGNFHKLILDHFSLRSDAFLDVVATFELLLEKSPTDFWDAMNAVTPSIATVVEQVLNGPKLKEMLSQASEGDAEKMGEISQAFQWIEPFLSSIKPANLTPACKAFANFLFNHLQSSAYPPAARTRCIKEGLRVLDYSFKKMNQGKNVTDFVGQPTVNGMLEILSTHIQAIVSALKRSDNPEARDNRALALSMIEQAFTLESQSLAVERKLILEKKPSPTETPPSRPIWKAVLSAIDSKSIDLAIRLLVAGRNLIGLEPLFMKPSAEKIPRTVQHFNDRFKLLSQSITDVVERLGEMDPERLGALFEKSTEASAIMSTLFSSTEDTRLAAVELIKVISLKDERREALQHILHTYYKNVLQGVSDSCRQVTRKRAFAPAPSLIKTCSDIIDVMCNSQDGLLRSRNLNSEDGAVTMNLWKNLWNTLTMIFRTTEDWSNLGAHDKNTMMDFCRDTMQFADQLFDANSIFLTALKDATLKEDDSSDLLIELLDLPGTTMGGMAKWLRLRDEFLSTKSVTLISKLLIRLQKVSVEVDPETLSYIDKILSGAIKAKLRLDQQAELEKALEIHLGHPKVKEEQVEKQARQVPISKWMATGSIADAKAREADVKSKLLAQATSASTAYNSVFQARREGTRAREAQILKQNENKAAQMSEFKKKRQAEQERLKAERAAAVAKAKKARGLSEHTAEAGSGLEGLGVLGKDQAPKGEGLMHSSDESEAEEEDFDAELFGMKEKKSRTAPKTNIINEVKVQMPVKKRKVIRSVKDMRARLAPDLSPLHKVILSWDFFHEGDFPPNSRPDIYTKISNTFRTPNDYQAAFEPLLTLEAWQSFVNFRGENELKPYEIRIVSRASVDAFQEVSSTMTHQENKNLNVSEGDIVLLSQSKMPSPEDRYCLARVFRVQRKQAHLEVSYRVLPSRSNGLQSALMPNGTVFGSKIQSITPLEREYAALLGLQYYDLCDEIIHAKPSPLLTYKENQLEPLIANYNVNKTQAKAVKSAMDNDAFTLIQGPPGTGKTKTIVAIVGALLSDSMRTASYGGRSDAATKKLLVCAPSNAAVDELVMRFKQGIKTLNGQERKINVVRLGRSDAINANVQDITLDELVNKRLGVNNDKGKDAEAKRKIFDEHKQISEQIRQVHAQLDAGTLPGPEASKLQDDLSTLRRRKQQLGSKIDSVKDEERVQSRNAELTRRRAQEHVLGEAHVICATLSGSGHDMFQGLSIEFETVIVDEAAQCVEMSALIPLKYGCSKCILVGDPKQLPPTVFSRHAARFQYEQSLFVRMQNNHPNDVHLLDTQYRMHPEISLFSSQTFYDGRLLDGDNMAGLRQRPWHTSALLSPYQFYDVQGRHSTAPGGRSSRNEAEINVAMQLYNRLTMDYKDIDFRGKIGIITPYKEQLRALKMRFSQQYGPDILTNVEFNTTDAFQGRECEIIIFSCVKASATGSVGFLKDIRRMNVGLTRAKSSLWVLGNAPTLCRGEFWNKLVVDAKKRGRFVEGNLMAMLGKHSSAFPAPNQSAAPPAPKIKQEPETYTWEPQMKSAEEFKASLGFGVKKEEPQADVKPAMKFEDTKPDLGFDGDGKRKMDLAFDEDIDMMDANSASASRSRSPAEASRRSTPATRSSATPAPDAANNNAAAPGAAAPQAPAGTMSGIAQPKVRKRPRKEVNPLMVRQPTKKPRPS